MRILPSNISWRCHIHTCDKTAVNAANDKAYDMALSIWRIRHDVESKCSAAYKYGVKSRGLASSHIVSFRVRSLLRTVRTSKG
jgi:hypothetical protein